MSKQREDFTTTEDTITSRVSKQQEGFTTNRRAITSRESELYRRESSGVDVARNTRAIGGGGDSSYRIERAQVASTDERLFAVKAGSCCGRRSGTESCVSSDAVPSDFQACPARDVPFTYQSRRPRRVLLSRLFLSECPSRTSWRAAWGQPMALRRAGGRAARSDVRNLYTVGTPLQA